jgi:anti-sigma-K factor RskA
MTGQRQQCPWSDSAAAFVLGALDEDEARRFEAHLEDCEACRADVATLAPAVDSVAASVPRFEPPPRLRARIMAQVHAEAELMRAAGPQADLVAPERGRARRRLPSLQWWRGWTAVAATALVAIAGVGGVLATREHKSSPRVVAAQIARAMAPNARGELIIGSDFATLRLRGMPQPPAGRVYQVWFRLPGRLEPQPTNVLFSVSADGTATVAVPRHPRAAREVLVTAEPAGGSRRPTSQPVLAARLS